MCFKKIHFTSHICKYYHIVIEKIILTDLNAFLSAKKKKELKEFCYFIVFFPQKFEFLTIYSIE